MEYASIVHFDAVKKLPQTTKSSLCSTDKALWVGLKQWLLRYRGIRLL